MTDPFCEVSFILRNVSIILLNYFQYRNYFVVRFLSLYVLVTVTTINSVFSVLIGGISSQTASMAQWRT